MNKLGIIAAVAATVIVTSLAVLSCSGGRSYTFEVRYRPSPHASVTEEALIKRIEVRRAATPEEAFTSVIPLLRQPGYYILTNTETHTGFVHTVPPKESAR